jgi:hypothetical protein
MTTNNLNFEHTLNIKNQTITIKAIEEYEDFNINGNYQTLAVIKYRIASGKAYEISSNFNYDYESGFEEEELKEASELYANSIITL